jgi:hypothetical protein
VNYSGFPNREVSEWERDLIIKTICRHSAVPRLRVLSTFTHLAYQSAFRQ